MMFVSSPHKIIACRDTLHFTYPCCRPCLNSPVYCRPSGQCISPLRKKEFIILKKVNITPLIVSTPEIVNQNDCRNPLFKGQKEIVGSDLPFDLPDWKKLVAGQTG